MAEVDLGGLGEGWLQLGPPSVIEGAHFGDLFWVGFRDVFFLTGVGFDVVEFFAIDEAELGGHDGGLTPLDGVDDALGVGDDEAVCCFFFDLRIEDFVEN